MPFELIFLILAVYPKEIIGQMCKDILYKDAYCSISHNNK